MKFRITYSHAEGVIAEHAKGDDLARYAATTYGHVLNTEERRGQTHSAREFAQAIRENYDMAGPQNASVVNHLDSLEPLVEFPTEEINLAAPNQQARGFILRPQQYRLFTNPITGSMVIGYGDGPPIGRKFKKGEEEQAAAELVRLNQTPAIAYPAPADESASLSTPNHTNQPNQ